MNIDELMDVASEPQEFNIFMTTNVSALTESITSRLLNVLCNSTCFRVVVLRSCTSVCANSTKSASQLFCHVRLRRSSCYLPFHLYSGQRTDDVVLQELNRLETLQRVRFLWSLVLPLSRVTSSPVSTIQSRSWLDLTLSALSVYHPKCRLSSLDDDKLQQS